MTIAAGERKREAFQLKPTEVGLTKLAVRVTGPGGIDVRRTLTFDVKVPAGDIKRMTVATLAPKGGKITLSSDLLHDLIPARTKVTVTVGPHGALDVPGILATLDRYPYGCAEQTVSRALPLLYVNAVAKRIGLASDAQLRERIDGAIARVLEMQDASGAFGVWGPSDGDMWLTSFVTDFLTRAKETGYAVRQQPFNQALDRLANYISYAQDFEQGGEAQGLCALRARPQRPGADRRAALLRRHQARQLRHAAGAGPARRGARHDGRPAARRARPPGGVPGHRRQRRRRVAARLRHAASATARRSSTLAAESRHRQGRGAAAGRPRRQGLRLGDLHLHAGAGLDAAGGPRAGRGGQGHAPRRQRPAAPGPARARAHGAGAAGGPLAVTNVGDGAVGAVVSVIGAALTPEPAISKGFTIERTYYTMDGKKIDLKSATGGTSQLKQNERLVVVLKVDATETGGRILLVDRLPAGLEIENPRLVDSGDVKSLDWLKTTVAPQHTEFRDDRFVAAFDFFGGTDGRRGRRGGSDGDSGNPSPAPPWPTSCAR